jgi:hypothetical protein
MARSAGSSSAQGDDSVAEAGDLDVRGDGHAQVAGNAEPERRAAVDLVGDAR